MHRRGGPHGTSGIGVHRAAEWHVLRPDNIAGHGPEHHSVRISGWWAGQRHAASLHTRQAVLPSPASAHAAGRQRHVMHASRVWQG